MKRITEQLQDGGVLVSDGAWGTELHKLGLEPGDCPELWCVERRADVLGVARSYIDAGADMTETNSFGANRFKLDHFGLSARVAELNEAAAAISREAAGADKHVLGSIGPTGIIVMTGPSGDVMVMSNVSERDVYDAFAEQACALERGGADACCIETFTSIEEGRIAVRAARENTELEIICTFTFDMTVRGEYRTSFGVLPADMAVAMLEAGADIIGTNCGNGMDRMPAIVAQLRTAAPAAPILVHANAGAPETVAGVDVFPETPEQTSVYVLDVVKAGANIVGGCCGSKPDHVKAIIRAVK